MKDADAVGASDTRFLYMYLGKARRGALTADSRFPSGFRHSVPSNSPLWIIQPRVDSFSSMCWLRVPTQIWGCGTERKTHKSESVLTQAVWPGIGFCSWEPEGTASVKLGAGSFVAAASSGSESTARSLGGRSHTDAISDCPGMLLRESHVPPSPSLCLLSLHRDKSGLGSCRLSRSKYQKISFPMASNLDLEAALRHSGCPE